MELVRQGDIYLTFVQNAFLKMLAYRLRYFTGILTYFLFVSVHFFIWSAVFAGRGPAETVNGFTLAEMITYVSIGWICRSLYHSNIDVEVDDLVRTGQISIYLLRPVNFQLMEITHAAGESLFRLLFFTLPISIIIFLVFPVGLPANFSSGVLFIIATGFSFLILASLNFLVGMLAFSFKSIEGVMRAKYYMVQLFSGLLLPLTFFPDWFESVLEFLPFKLIAYVPLQIYLGKITPSNTPSVFLEEFIWLVVLVLLGRSLWLKAFAKLTLQGG